MAKKLEDRPLTDEQKLVIKKIGEKVRKKRIEKGSTSYQTFAFENEISQAYFGEVERGKKDFSISYLVSVLSSLNVSLEDFFSGFKEPKKTKPSYPKRAK